MQALQTLTAETRQFLIRTQTMMIGSIILAPIIFVVQFGPHIIHMLQTGSGLNENYAGEVTSRYIVNILRDASAHSAAKIIIVFILWAIVGLLAYLLLLSVIRWALSVRNEIIIDTRYSKGSAARLLALHFGKKLLVAVSLVGFVLFCGIILIPYFMDLMRIFLYDISIQNAALLVVGILGLIITIYAVTSLAYITMIYEESV